MIIKFLENSRLSNLPAWRTMISSRKTSPRLFAAPLLVLLVIAESSVVATSFDSWNGGAEKKQKQHVLMDRWAPNTMRIRIYPDVPPPPDYDKDTALGYLLPPLPPPSGETAEEQAAALHNLEATIAADTGFCYGEANIRRASAVCANYGARAGTGPHRRLESHEWHLSHGPWRGSRLWRRMQMRRWI
jgi:hypothetical protein